MRYCLLLIICGSLVLFYAHRAFSETQTASLEKKGMGRDVLGLLNPACKDALDTDFQNSHSYWNALWSKKGKSVSVDFLQGTKHYSFVFQPLKDGSCQTSRTITAYWTMECKELASQYNKNFPKGSTQVKEEQKTFLWMTTGKGTDIYMYKVPGGCVEIFKEFYQKQAR